METVENAQPVAQAAAIAQAETDFEKWAKLPDEEQNVVAAPKSVPAAEPAADPDDVQAARPEGEETPEPEVPKGLQKRFRELTTKIRNLENEAAAARARAAANPAQAPQAAAATSSDANAKPDVRNFDSYEKYLEALTTWTIKDAQAKAAQEVATQRAQTAARERNAAWQKELDAARDRHADFDAVALTDLPINRATHNAIVQGGWDGAELAYYLGQHKDEAAEIFKLSPTATVLALGKILAKIETRAAAAATPIAVSRAPKPATPVAARGPAVDKEPDPRDFTKWQAWYRRQQATEEE